MADSLSGWLHKPFRREFYKSSKSGPKTKHAVLPVVVPRQPDLLTPPNAASAATDGPIFQRLPIEIRRQILIAAFGGRVIHVDLSLGHAPPAASSQEQRRRRGGGNPASLLLFRDRAPSSASAQKASVKERRAAFAAREQRLACVKEARIVASEVRMGDGWDFEVLCSCGGGSVCWQFLGRVCQHQNLDTLRRGRHDFVNPHCRLGCCHPTGAEQSVSECVHGRNLHRDNCHWGIGVSGWLRTCKQAYLEGIDVLYTTNTFQLSGTVTSSPANSPLQNGHELVLLRHLPDLLLADTLQSVKIAWDMWMNLRRPKRPPLNPEDWPNQAAKDLFQQFLSRLPQSLPNIKSLYLDVEGVYLPTSEPWDTNQNFQRSQRAETDIFGPVDAMFRRLNKDTLQEFYLGVPYTIFKHRLDAGGPKNLWLEPAQQRSIQAGTARREDMDLEAACRRQRVWRWLPPPASPAQHGDQVDVSDSKTAGYWINHSDDDYISLQYCFGSGPSVDYSQYPHPFELDPN